MEPLLAPIVDEPAVAGETVDHIVRPESEVVEHAADQSALASVTHEVEVREQGCALADAPDAVVDRNAFRRVQRMRVNPEGSEDPQCRPLRLGRVNNRPRLSKE